MRNRWSSILTDLLEPDLNPFAMLPIVLSVGCRWTPGSIRWRPSRGLAGLHRVLTDRLCPGRRPGIRLRRTGVGRRRALRRRRAARRPDARHVRRPTEPGGCATAATALWSIGTMHFGWRPAWTRSTLVSTPRPTSSPRTWPGGVDVEPDPRAVLRGLRHDDGGHPCDRTAIGIVTGGDGGREISRPSIHAPSSPTSSGARWTSTATACPGQPSGSRRELLPRPTSGHGRPPVVDGALALPADDHAGGASGARNYVLR